ncbi:RidA family protein [soil metagenome]
MRTLLAAILAAPLMLAAVPVAAQEIKRDVTPPTSFLARSVEVPPGASTLYLSGIPSAVAGGTGPQTADVLAKLGVALKAAGYDYADVVNVKVYLVGDITKEGKMDFAGMNDEYKKVFGTAANPAKPSRVTVQIAGLALPGALVEIEMTAAKVKK